MIAKEVKCKAKGCKNKFKPSNSFHRTCSPTCAINLVKETNKAKEKNDKKILKLRKEAIKPRRQWLKEVQVEFNRYIRERDRSAPCISCGRHHTGQYHAGHYRTVGSAPELRFNEDNVNKQCSACNNYLSGNLVEYRKNLLEKIGSEALAKLEGNHDLPKWSIEELKEMKAFYKQKFKTEANSVDFSDLPF